MTRPLLRLALAFVTGVALAPLLEGALAPGLALAVLGGALTMLRGRWPLLRGAARDALLLASAGLSGAVAAAAGPEGMPSLAAFTDAPVALRAIALDAPEPNLAGWSVEATLSSAAAPGEPRHSTSAHITLFGEGAPPAIGRGQAIAALARLRELRVAGNPGEGDHTARRIASGEGLRGSPVTGTTVVPLRMDDEAPPSRPLVDLRDLASAALRAHLPVEPAEVLSALLLGQQRLVRPETRALFADTGTAHLLAISGLHLGLIAVLVLGIAQRALCRVPALLHRGLAPRLAAVVTVALCVAYTLLTGAHLPTVRAAVMIAVHLGGRALGLRSDSATSLAAAALVLLLADPLSLHDAGFQLSFAAVGALLLLGPRGVALASRVCPGAERLARLGRWAALLAWTSLVAWAATAPVLLIHFGSVPLGAPLVNLLAVPYLGIVLLPAALGLVALAVLLPPVAHLALAPLDPLVSALTALLRASRPAMLPVSGSIGLLGATLVALLLLLVGSSLVGRLLGSLRWRPSPALSAAAVALVALGLGRCGDPGATPELTVVFLNVGHGDATIVRLPDGSGLLIDGGGRHGDDGATGRRVVLPALRALGITRLRAMVLTHPDADHLHGLLPVAVAMPPEELWWNGQVVASPTEVVLVATLLAAGTRLEVVGDLTPPRTLAGVEVDVLAPAGRGPEPTYDAAAGPNDSSVVLLLRFGEVSVLLTGDAEAETERRVAASRRLRPPISVLKVPHHGSTTSSSLPFVAAVRAAHAVASGDERGRHRLPKPGVLARWRAAGARVHRTDHHGAITFTTDGQQLRVDHGLPGK